MKFFLSVELTALDNVDYYTGQSAECQGFFQKNFRRAKNGRTKVKTEKIWERTGEKSEDLLFSPCYGTMVARSNHCSSPLGRHNARPAILLRKNRGKLIGCFMVQWLLEATIVVPTLPPKAGRQFAGRRTPVETHQMFYGTMVVENNHCSSPLGLPTKGLPPF